jgi:hypothetical protein
LSKGIFFGCTGSGGIAVPFRETKNPLAVSAQEAEARRWERARRYVRRREVVDRTVIGLRPFNRCSVASSSGAGGYRSGMVRRSFRIGLRLGLLFGVGFALFKTYQSRRSSS